jgi:hypothetical protein
MPNLLYSTVEPFSRVLQSGPSSITSPARAEGFERNDAREGSVSRKRRDVRRGHAVVAVKTRHTTDVMIRSRVAYAFERHSQSA